MTLLFESADWDFATLDRIYDACGEIALGELGLDIYPNQIEIISAEQMLDAYSSRAMPLMYRHWKFGKHFAMNENLYRRGLQGLAYEVVINSVPVINYLMEENTSTMQTLVIAHAAFGHNHFFKNNYLFKEWTDASGILEYMAFAKKYIQECEDKYGEAEVERILDAAHALERQGVDRYPRQSKNLASEEDRESARREHMERTWDPIWSTLPDPSAPAAVDPSEVALAAQQIRARLKLPEENLLYFVEKNAPKLKQWQREVVRIVRKIAQYFYPQPQLKVMNEGCATWTHHRIMQCLHERGQISDGNFLEFLRSHTSVVFQPEFEHPGFSGFNPYALGFAMMQDIERICTDPTAEDREWFPDIAGNGDGVGTLRSIWANYRDESFVSQFLSPKVMRDFRIFHIADRRGAEQLRVDAIHDEAGYRDVRRRLAESFDVGRQDPDINIVDVDLGGDRKLVLQHMVHGGRMLDEQEAAPCLAALRDLWGYPVELVEVDALTDEKLKVLHSNEW